MAEQPTGDLLALVEAAELSDIGLFELTAHRGGRDENGNVRIVGPGPLEVDDFPPLDHSLEVFWSEAEDQFMVRMTSAATGAIGDLTVGVQAEYILEGITRSDISPETEQRFVNDVALMHLAPYIREAVADVSRRVFGASITLGVLMRGELEFSPAPTDTSLVPGSAGD